MMSRFKKPLSICAIIATRNESHYLEVLLPLLASQKIDVIIVDNSSTDGSHALYHHLRKKPIIAVETLPYRGYYSLSDLLEKKREIAESINHDWIIHHDSDEIMEHRQPGFTLRDAIRQADEAGYNVINFDEFVFLPEADADYSRENYYTNLLRYYFFEPMKSRLHRACKRSCHGGNFQSGGHIVQSDAVSIAPENHVLRHYITLSQEHVRNKYLNRIYDRQCITRGWHWNKLHFTVENLTLPESNDFLFRLNSYDSKDFSTVRPATSHFWEWDRHIKTAPPPQAGREFEICPIPVYPAGKVPDNPGA